MPPHTPIGYPYVSSMTCCARARVQSTKMRFSRGWVSHVPAYRRGRRPEACCSHCMALRVQDGSATNRWNIAAGWCLVSAAMARCTRTCFGARRDRCTDGGRAGCCRPSLHRRQIARLCRSSRRELPGCTGNEDETTRGTASAATGCSAPGRRAHTGPQENASATGSQRVIESSRFRVPSPQ